MILLDTNVISELMKPAPSVDVEAWLAAQPASMVFTTTITEAELRYGIAMLPAGKRRKSLGAAVEAMLREDFSDRILPFDSSAAIAYAEIAARRYEIGRPISQFDAQIAAIAKSRGATLATRNFDDFDDCGIDVVNPWDSGRR